MIFIIIVRILDKILDISDNMLDYAINICEDLDMSEKSNQNVSLEITTWQIEGVQENTHENINIKFHVYAPKEFCNDIENFQFGIMSSLNNWTEMNDLKASTLSSGGYLVTGNIEVPVSVNEFEYKYVIKDINNDNLTWEQPGNVENIISNRKLIIQKSLSKDLKIDAFDGIMIPPGCSKDVLRDNKEEAIELMVSEMLENTDLLFETAKMNVKSLFMGLARSMKQHDIPFINRICAILMKQLAKKNESNMSFIVAAALLANREECEYWTVDTPNLNSVLSCLHLDDIKVFDRVEKN